jgi:hypothetical protein
MMESSILNQPQQPSMPIFSLPQTPTQQLSLPTTTNSSPLPTNINPFIMGKETQQPFSSSTFLSPPSQQLTLFQPTGGSLQQQQQQTTMPTGNTNFASSISPSTTSFSNPFIQQQMQPSFQTPQFTGMNPFGMSTSSPLQQQQQQQPQQQNQQQPQQSWGSSSVF